MELAQSLGLRSSSALGLRSRSSQRVGVTSPFVPGAYRQRVVSRLRKAEALGGNRNELKRRAAMVVGEPCSEIWCSCLGVGFGR